MLPSIHNMFGWNKYLNLEQKDDDQDTKSDESPDNQSILALSIFDGERPPTFDQRSQAPLDLASSFNVQRITQQFSVALPLNIDKYRIEQYVATNKIKELRRCFFENPGELFKHADLLRSLCKTKLKIDDLISILGDVACSQWTSKDTPSILRIFQEEVKAALLSSTEISLNMRNILIQDANASDSAAHEVIRFVLGTEREPKSFVHLLSHADFNDVDRIFNSKDEKNSSFFLRHNCQALDIALQQLPLEVVIQNLTDRNVMGEQALDRLSVQRVEALPNFQKIQLLLKLSKLHIKIPENLNRFFLKYSNEIAEYHLLLSQPTLSDVLRVAETLNSLDSDSKYAAIAEYIELYEIKMLNVHLLMAGEEFLRLSDHLKYLDFRGFIVNDVGRKFIKSCSKPYRLMIDSHKILKEISTLPYCLELDCSNCESLPELPELPVCRVLKCNNCKSLTWLPPLPGCQMLECSNCCLLRKLPALFKCKLLICSNCSSLVELPELRVCKELFCSGCINLKGLPDFVECLKLYCDNCPQVTKLPELLKCRVLSCAGCVGITRISKLPECEKVDCSQCSSLIEIAGLPVCRELMCQECPKLRAFPLLPVCYKLLCAGCVNLSGFPDLPFGAYVSTETAWVEGQAKGFPFINIDVDDLEKDPIKPLLQVSPYLLNNKPFPNIYYFKNSERVEEQRNDDLRFDFVKRLLTSTLKKEAPSSRRIHFSGFPELCTHSENPQNEILVFRTIGALLALCYLNNSFFRSDPLPFSKDMYACLTVGDPGLPGQEASKEWLMNASVTFYNFSENLKKFVLGSGGQFVCNSEEKSSLEYNLRQFNNQFKWEEFMGRTDENKRIKIQQALVHEAKTQSNILPTKIIAQEMKSKLGSTVWAELQASTPEVIKIKIEIESLLL